MAWQRSYALVTELDLAELSTFSDWTPVRIVVLAGRFAGLRCDLLKSHEVTKRNGGCLFRQSTLRQFNAVRWSDSFRSRILASIRGISSRITGSDRA